MCLLYPQRTASDRLGWELHRSSRMGATDGCELPCGCWELYPGPLEEQSVLLTTPMGNEPSPHSLGLFIIRIKTTPMFLCSVLLYIFGVPKKFLKMKPKFRCLNTPV